MLSYIISIKSFFYCPLYKVCEKLSEPGFLGFLGLMGFADNIIEKKYILMYWIMRFKLR